MAWEPFEWDAQTGITGDKPVDEFAVALSRIAQAYQNRFDRPPTVAELRYAFETALASLADRTVPSVMPASSLDLTQYEGVYSDREDPGYYLVQRRAEQPGEAVDVLTVPTLRIEDRTLVCEYRILDPGLTDGTAQALIVGPLLHTFCGGYYDDRADTIRFERLPDAPPDIPSTVP